MNTKYLVPFILCSLLLLFGLFPYDPGTPMTVQRSNPEPRSSTNELPPAPRPAAFESVPGASLDHGAHQPLDLQHLSRTDERLRF